jgi:hypothetical protein
MERKAQHLLARKMLRQAAGLRKREGILECFFAVAVRAMGVF